MAKNKSVGTENQNKMAQSTAVISNLIFFESSPSLGFPVNNFYPISLRICINYPLGCDS
jgi:hypothetical protein